jgi:hypothetical protein
MPCPLNPPQTGVTGILFCQQKVLPALGAKCSVGLRVLCGRKFTAQGSFLFLDGWLWDW